MKKNLFLLLLLFVFVKSQAQLNSCASTSFNSFLKNQSTSLANEVKSNLDYYHLITSNGIQKISSVPLIVPVVFHVVHMNGPENVPDSLLLSDLAALNAWFSNSAPYYNPLGTDVGIQFCLASVDPYGNPTNGITHDTSHYTDIQNFYGDELLKNVNRWNPYQYLNIWIGRNVLNTYGASAYAAFPWDAGKANDGVVIQYNSLGGSHFIINHEVGHYLGLYHTFEGDSCVNFNCLLDGDNVCDTPPELKGNTVCNISSCSSDMDDTSGLNPFTTDVNDLSNLMGPKQNCFNYYFTQGQSDRMNYFLPQSRSQLLQSNGCGQHPGGIVPTASFTYQERTCNFFKFTSTSTNAQYSEWDFNNDGYFEASGDSVGHFFSHSGNYTVVLRVFNSGGFDTDTLTAYFHARPTPIYPLLAQNGIHQYGACFGTTVTFMAVPGMASYHWNTGDSTQSISFVADSSFDITLTCLDSTGYVWQRCPSASIHYNVNPIPAPALLTTSAQDTLCRNDTIPIVAHIQAGTIPVHWVINNFHGFTPDTTVTLFPFATHFAVYYIVRDSTTCLSNSDTLNFYCEPDVPTPFPYVVDSVIYGINGWHNQFYFNGTPIAGATQSYYYMSKAGCYSVACWFLKPDCEALSDTFCYVPLGIRDFGQGVEQLIFPNPSEGKFSILLNAAHPLNQDFRIQNSIGENVNANIIVHENLATIDLSNFPDGIYLMQYGDKLYKLIKMNSAERR